MADISNIVMRPGGLVVQYTDGTDTTGTFKIIAGIMTMEGFTELQQLQLQEFLTNVDFSALRDPRLDGTRCIAPDIEATAPSLDPTATLDCSVIDIAFAVDVTDSMADVVTAMKSQVTDYVDLIVNGTAGSFGSYRLGLVTFRDADDVNVDVSFSLENRVEFEVAIAAMTASGGDGPTAPISAASVEALGKVLDGDLGWLRTPAAKIIILITDAPPGGPDGEYTQGVDDVAANAAAQQALDMGVHIGAILTRINLADSFDADAVPIMRNYADVTLGRYSQNIGSEVVASILNVINSMCGT